jgi:sugar phosphate isomerase/epimerase
VADPAPGPSGGTELVASFFTLAGAGFGQPPRNTFVQRCEAAAGFAGIGLHTDDLARTRASGLDPAGMRRVNLRLVEIGFIDGWALDVDAVLFAAAVAEVEAVADLFGGRHMSAGEFRPGHLDLDAAATRLTDVGDRLDQRALLVALEAFPWSAVDNVGTAVELLRRAGSVNARLMVDVWHFFNGGAALDGLDGLDGQFRRPVSGVRGASRSTRPSSGRCRWRRRPTQRWPCSTPLGGRRW